MKIPKKRDCAKKANILIKKILKTEEMDDLQFEALKKKVARKNNSSPTSSSSQQGQKPKRAAPVPAAGKTEKEDPMITCLKGSKAYMMCADCKLPIFHCHGGPSQKVCDCGHDLFYGCFWQEPHPLKKSLLQTVACYRAMNQSYWGRAKTPMGNASTVQMIIKLPGGKMRFDPHTTRVN